jgi:Flp pilus assembly protein TadG
MRKANGLTQQLLALAWGLIRQAKNRSAMAMDKARRLGCWAEDGTSLVEFAITLPLMMTVLTGSASFCMALYSFQQLGNATSATAQQLAAEQGLITDPCATAVTTVIAALPNWTASKLTYTVTITNSSGTATKFGPTTGSSFTCTSGAADMAANEPVVVTVSYAYTWFPILAFSPSGSISSTEAALME